MEKQTKDKKVIKLLINIIILNEQAQFTGM